VTADIDRKPETGLHHVTGITADVQSNVDFYVGFLGLRLVKQTGGYADAEQLHLFYGDEHGSPGSLLTFLVWQDSGRGQTGIGQVSEVALAVPPASIADWVTKALTANIPFEGPTGEFGERVLRLKDPDGLIVKLVGVRDGALTKRPGRLRGVTLLTDKAAETAQFLTRFGYRPGQRVGLTQRMISDTDVVDVREVSGFVPSVPGAGVPDHVAFRAGDVGAVRAMHLSLKKHMPTEVHDRHYFLSLYVRDPAGILMEYATDGPGLTVDEAAAHLGQTLFLPRQDADRADDLRAMMPQFALPGEERFPARNLPFVHRLNRADHPDGVTLVLLHGTGGDEANLMPFARRIAPRATLLGVRGRATEDGKMRWFRLTDRQGADEADARSEAAAFAAFMKGAVAGYGLDADRIAFLGYSNGANFLAAVIQLYPDTARHAVLIRSAMAISVEPADMSANRVLMLDGRADTAVAVPVSLAGDLMARGATVETVAVNAGHELSAEDATEVTRWLRETDLDRKKDV
jgi:phospholipase/carboxylesterase